MMDRIKPPSNRRCVARFPVPLLFSTAAAGLVASVLMGGGPLRVPQTADPEGPERIGALPLSFKLKRPPEPGWSVDVLIKMTDRDDADTLTVYIVKKARIRLEDVNAPERYTKEGKEATKFIRELADGKKARLFVPAKAQLGKETSFGRIVGRLWLEGDEKRLAQHLVESGHAQWVKR